MAIVPEIFRKVTERLETSASVKTVYGEPMSIEGKAIIPVARVRYGFGAGGGSVSSGRENSDSGAENSGGGGGGGIEVTPVGIIEITAGETRFIPFEEKRRIVRALVIGTLIALFLLLRRKRRK